MTFEELEIKAIVAEGGWDSYEVVGHQNEEDARKYPLMTNYSPVEDVWVDHKNGRIVIYFAGEEANDLV